MASCLSGDFQVIHDPDPPSLGCVDVVIVHGIGDQIWLRTLLPMQVPTARIMSVGYNQQVFINNGVDGAVSSLLSELQYKRQQRSERPLVFVCYSLGGIIVQQALLRAQMDSKHMKLRWATIGAVFIRTPHSGHPIESDNIPGSLLEGRPTGRSRTAGEKYHQQCLDNFAKTDYHFRLIAASLRVVRICTDDCEANCGNNPGEWRFGPNDLDKGVHRVEGSHCIIKDNTSVNDTVRLVGQSIARIIDGLQRYKDDFENLALSSSGRLSSRHPGTFTWFFKRPEFEIWLNGREPTLLWIQGRPGSGKTTLTSYVAEHLEATKSKNDIQVAYFFKRGMASDPSKELLASMLRQILERTSQAYNKAQLYKVLARIDHNGPSLSSCHFGMHLRAMLGSLDTTDMLTLFIDGLDEWDGLRNQIANEIVQLNFMVRESRHVRCLITSRSDCSSHLAACHVSRVNLNGNYSVQQDISLVIQDKCAEFCARFPSHQKSFQTLASRFSTQSQASFLEVSLMLHDVSRYLYLNKADLCIDYSPSQIEAVYQHRLASIPERQQTFTSRVFLVLTYTARQLRLSELNAALSFSFSGMLDPDIVVSEEFLLNCCGGLVTINEDQTVHFVHNSIREFLTSEDNRLLLSMYFVDRVQAHAFLAQICLQCLLQWQQLRVSSFHRENSARNDCLLHRDTLIFEPYAAKYWSLHYRIAESQDNYLAGMLQEMVDISIESRIEGQQTFNMPQNVTKGVSTSQNKVFRVCAQSGAATLGQICLEMGVDVNTKFCRYGVSALHIAAASGHAEMVEFLIRRGAAIDAQASIQGRTALHYACFRGDTIMVEVLLRHGAHSGIKTVDYAETPLHVAVAGGHLEVIALLLASGADINVATSFTEETPLHLAAAYGFVDEASYLLGARWHGWTDVEKVWSSRGPLGYRKERDDLKLKDRRHLDRTGSFDGILRFVKPNEDFAVDLAYDSRPSQSADIGARNRDGWTPLHVAAAWGNLNIVELLLDQGADINAKTFDGYSALYLAEEYGHQAITSLLGGWSCPLATDKDQPDFKPRCHKPDKSDRVAMDPLLQGTYKIESVLLENHEDWTAIILNNKDPKQALKYSIR